MAEEYTNPQRRPRRRKRRSKFQRFMHRYFPSIMLVVLSVCCVSAVVFTISTISGMVQNRPTEPQLNSAPSTTVTDPTNNVSAEQIEALIKQADKLAAGYDYAGAITLLESFSGYESQTALTDKIAAYKAEDSKLVSYPDLDNITHIFFHSLIADPARAFDGDDEQTGFNLYMVTIAEFEKILQSMYDRGFVLVSPYDIAYEVSDEIGTRFVYGNIRLPEGKTPFLMSQDDVNYYGYMIGSGNGIDETPVFASTDGDGFASRIVIGEGENVDHGRFCETRDFFGRKYPVRSVRMRM